MSITIDNNSGFCFGVTRAITTAESELKNGPLFCLGDIVHNGEEVERLAKLGLETIDYDDLRTLRSGRVLFRAHGEPPSTYRIAHDNGLEIIDASCPVVMQLQKRIRDTYTANPDAQIVIFGKPGHAEVIGLQGQTGNTALVIQATADIEKIDFHRPVFLFSQTTMSVEEYQHIADEIRKRANQELHVYDTICRNVANRAEHMREFARAHDLVIFVGGRKSSNAQVLFSHCREANPNTLFISSPEEITLELLSPFLHGAPKSSTGGFGESGGTSRLMPQSGSLCDLVAERIGICGATSTPLWLMEACRDRLQQFND